MPMKRGIVVAMLVAASVVGVAPTHAKAKHSGLSCKAVHEALASGKTKDEVATQMKTTTAAVERCEAKATTQAKTTTQAKKTSTK
jgi:hypothetical protein